MTKAERRAYARGLMAAASQFGLADASGRDAWAHPVLLHGRLYLRYHDTLWCYDVKDRR